ncbi:MAG: hypothetical protein ABSH20_26135, partial [Tepidisphaeraceae bacterium]
MSSSSTEARDTGSFAFHAAGCNYLPVPTLIEISSLDDPRIAAYTRLKERDLSREGGRFIAEGHLVVQRLLASRIGVESLLVARERLGAMLPHIPPGMTVY